MPASRQPRTRRVQTAGVPDAFRFSVVAPGQVRAGGGHTALALADALGVASKATAGEIVRRDRAAFEQGAEDFATGNVNTNDKREAYLRAHSRLRAKADWVQDSAVLAEEIRQSDVQTIDELDGLIDERLQEKYAGVDSDPYAAEYLVDEMAAFRARERDELVTRQTLRITQQQQADLTVTAEADYARGEFDHSAIHADVRTLFPEATNDVYFEIIKDIAVRNGDPELLRSIPDKWEDGQRTLKDIPKFNEKLLNAEQRALAARAAMDAKAEAERGDAQEAAINAQYIGAFKALHSGDYGTAMDIATRVSTMPGADANDILTFQKALTAVQGGLEDRAGYEPAAAEVVASVYGGEAGRADILSAYRNGIFGEGEQATRRMVQLLEQVGQMGARRDSDLNRTVSGFKANLKDSYKPDTILGKYDQTLAEIRNAALLEFDNRVYVTGEDPAEAFQAIKEKYDPRADRTLNISQSQAFTAPEAVTAFLDGTISSHRMQESGVNADVLDQMYLDGTLSPEQVKRLANSLYR